MATLVDPRLVTHAMEGNHGNRAWAERTIRECETVLDTIHAEMGPTNNPDDIKSISGSNAEKIQKMVELHSELTAARDVMRNIELLGQEGATIGMPPTLGNVLANDRAFMERVAGAGQGANVQQTAEIARVSDAMGAVDRSDYVPEVYKRGPIIQTQLLRQYSPTASLGGVVIVPRNVEGGTIRHKREVPGGKPAARAEGAKATNLTPTLENVDQKIESISAGVNAITDEFAQDYPGGIRHVGDLATRQALIVLDDAIAGGNGSSPNLLGANDLTGVIAQKHTRVNGTTDRGPEDPMTEIRKAMTKVWNTGDVPDTVWMHPDIWEAIQTKQTATEGLFVYGPPINSPQDRIWGLNIALSKAVADNITAWAANEDWGVVGPFRTGCDLYMKQQATFELGWIGNDFSTFQRTGRVTLRAAMVWYKPGSFVRIGSGAD